MGQEQNNEFYQEGLKIGRTYGRISSIDSILKRNALSIMERQDIVDTIFNTYLLMEETIPMDWLEKYHDISVQECNLWFLGYQNGK
jgi:hypothetical protein